jgi:uncharacterized protein YndB with AHSA1/START domain
MRLFVESQIRIKASSQRILAAFTDIEDLEKWWGVYKAFVQKKDGGLYTLTWLRTVEGIKFISTGRIRFFDRRSHLHLEDVLYINYDKPILGPFTITYDIEEHSHYSILKVKQGGFEKGPDHEWYYKAVAEGWPEALVMLKTYLENL